MFFDEFLKTLKQNQTFASFSLTLLGFNALLIQGKFEIDFFSNVKIVLSQKKQKIFVYGQNFELKNIDNTQMMIVGKILGISQKEVNFE